MNPLTSPLQSTHIAANSTINVLAQARRSLSAVVLHTSEERLLVSHLREQTDYKSEYLLDPGLAMLEERKDDLGMVMALMLNEEPIATIRFIPSGHELTLTERYWPDMVTDPAILGAGSWEVGRLVMAPEHRQSNLLHPSLALALRELLKRRVVKHLHASCLTRMTRLYRRFGFQVHAQRNRDRLDCALIHAPVGTAIKAFKLDAQANAYTPWSCAQGPLLQ